MIPHPNFVKAIEGEKAKLAYLISEDAWVFSFEGAHWKAPGAVVQLANSGPYEVTVSVGWLIAHGERF
jgi:hypothetical protein